MNSFVWDFRHPILAFSVFAAPSLFELLSAVCRKQFQRTRREVFDFQEPRGDRPTAVFCTQAVLLNLLGWCCFFLKPEIFLPLALWWVVAFTVLIRQLESEEGFCFWTCKTHLWYRLTWAFVLACGGALFLWWLIHSWPYLVSNQATLWDFGSSRLPPQPRALVFVEYLVLALAHGLWVLRSLHKSDDFFVCLTRVCRFGFHIVCAIWSVVLPICYWLMANQELRLHHSFTGLLLQAVPLPPLQIFASLMTVDSSLYLLGSKPGHWVSSLSNVTTVLDLPIGQPGLQTLVGKVPTSVVENTVLHDRPHFQGYDFMNIIADHLMFSLSGLAVMCLVHVWLHKTRYR